MKNDYSRSYMIVKLKDKINDVYDKALVDGRRALTTLEIMKVKMIEQRINDLSRSL